MVGQRDITLLITPLALYDKAHLNRLDVIASHDKLHRTPLIRFQHWAIEIGEQNVYEVTSRDSEDGTPRFRKIARSHWWDERRKQSTKPQSRLIGVTSYSDDALDSRSQSIWDFLFEKEYHLLQTNCQVFASIFWAAIRMPLRELQPEKEAQIQRLPAAMNPFTFVEHKAKQVGKLAVVQKNNAYGVFSWIVGKGSSVPNHHVEETKPEDQNHDIIPHRPTSSWLDDLNEDAAINDMNHKGDFHDMVRRVNERRSKKRQREHGSMEEPTDERSDSVNDSSKDKPENGAAQSPSPPWYNVFAWFHSEAAHESRS